MERCRSSAAFELMFAAATGSLLVCAIEGSSSWLRSSRREPSMLKDFSWVVG
jgi:hypothetical protein